MFFNIIKLNIRRTKNWPYHLYHTPVLCSNRLNFIRVMLTDRHTYIPIRTVLWFENRFHNSPVSITDTSLKIVGFTCRRGACFRSLRDKIVHGLHMRVWNMSTWKRIDVHRVTGRHRAMTSSARRRTSNALCASTITMRCNIRLNVRVNRSQFEKAKQLDEKRCTLSILQAHPQISVQQTPHGRKGRSEDLQCPDTQLRC